jgi:hypothetical protein
MSWTTPRDWSPGELITADIQNSAIRDNLLVVQGAVLSKAADYTIVAADFAGGVVTVKCDTATPGAAITITLPASSGLAGYRVNVILADATFTSGKSTGTVIVDGSGSELINGLANTTLFLEFDHVSMTCDGTGWIIINERCSIFAEYTQAGGAQTFAHNTWAQNVWDTAAVDSGSCFSGGGFVVPTGMAGYYDLKCHFRWDTPTGSNYTSDPATFHQLFYKNGSQFQSYVALSVPAAGRPSFVFVAAPLLAAGDDIEVWAKEATGISVDTTIDPIRHMFWARLVRRTYA